MGAGGGAHVAGDELHVGIVLPDPQDGVEHASRVAVRRVDAGDVDLGLDERFHAGVGVLGHAHRCAYAQTAQLVLAGAGELDLLHDVFDGDESAEFELVVHNQELLDLVDLELMEGLVEGGAHRDRHQVLGGHQLPDGPREVVLEPGVTVGDDAGQRAVGVHDGHSGDLVLSHERFGVAVGGGRRQGDGIDDHPRLAPFHLADHVGLAFDGLVLVDDREAAFAGQGDREGGLGDGVHRGTEQRDVQLDCLGEPGADIRALGKDPRLRRDQEHVVKRQALRLELPHPIDHADLPPSVSTILAESGADGTCRIRFGRNTTHSEVTGWD